uniref:Non-homologous end-joining factor 1 n=1 Tax=Cuerna arida TaxID=1464854 RepID=A0A1B6FZR2_9HEMI
MWNKINIDEKEFLLKHITVGSAHKICITDLVQLWYEDVQEEQLLCRCKELNKLVEASDDVFHGYILSLLESEADDIVRSSTTADDCKTLMLQTNLDGLKFRIKFFLKPGSSSEFYEEVTRPLLTVVAEMERRHQLLVEAIKGKDLEILEYKLEGGQISRKAVETTPFDLDAFSTKCAGDISTTKSVVITHPAQTFTPFTQDLMEKISAAPILPSRKLTSRQEKVTVKKTSIIKLKSPSRNKKPKMYDDDEDEDCGMNNETKQEQHQTKVKQEDQAKQRKIKENTKRRVTKVLSNL